MRTAATALEPGIRERLRRQALSVISLETAGKPVSCPFLLDDCCSIYGSRPVICRTQGLPLLLQADDGVMEVDFCPLNFALPGATMDLDDDYLVPLEDLNEKLARANVAALLSWGRNPSQAERISAADIILRSA